MLEKNEYSSYKAATTANAPEVEDHGKLCIEEFENLKKPKNFGKFQI